MKVPALATIGYEGRTLAGLIDVLRGHGITLLVDVRAVANSRRPGFGKTKLSAGLEEAGIGYLHLRGLGTPADGRAAARRGDHQAMRAIFVEHLRTIAAEEDLHALGEIVQGGAHACLLCLEAEHTHCHRAIIAERLRAEIGAAVEHL